MSRPEDCCASDPTEPLSGPATTNQWWALRRRLSHLLGPIGVVLYNWWVYVLVATSVLTNTDEFFSDLEATGRPDATLFQHLDLAAGVVMVVAIVLRGPWGPKGRRREWPWLVAFAVAGGLGGHFSYACPEGLSATCRSAEWHLRLPLYHYLHIALGVIEFAMMTIAVYVAWKRTCDEATWVARAVKGTAVAMLVGYPLMAVAYLANEFGALIEPIFFVAFSVMVMVELFEPSPKGLTRR